MSKKIIILDVEGMQTARPYNVGYMVADNKGKVYKKESFAILPCIWENLQNCLPAKEMTHKNIQEILANPVKYNWTMPEEVMDSLVKDVKAFNVKQIWAYNVTFDRGSMKRLYGDKFHELADRVEFLDIWTAIVVTRLCTKKYVKFCRENGFVSEKGNCRTSAEVVWKYLSKNVDFEEEHTGLADCEIEYQIYLTAKNSKKKMDGKTKNPWRLVKEFCEKNGI